MSDEKFMQAALELAEKGCGNVNPNPMVGAVIVKNGNIIGRGFHEKFGGSHAEINALTNCTKSPIDAELYVTLEPCCHYGKTPPCTEAIIKSGIRRVVLGTKDPNPVVSGKGIEKLLQAGIKVTVGVMEKECIELNEVFFHYIKTHIPFVVMKYAMTIDGKIATCTGESKWITGKSARRKVHEDRNRFSAVMVGVGTVIIDDPTLTCRIENGKNPVRIICDTSLRTPLDSKIISTAENVPTYIATACTEAYRHKPFIDAGCHIICVSKKTGYINLSELMTKLGEMNIDSILLEGGSTLNWSALKNGIVNKIQAYISPKIFGGSNAKTPVGGLGIENPGNAFFLKNSIVTSLDEDILIESQVIKNVYGNN